ncbi:HEAT repeat protein-like protein [Boeremia exigua]|uniref:HEAT repeat protein-like protein n=1 Tax=Boeremia exigua TaxID=749465 RepID=UPI001E8E54A3|nr:HEAT repeat protein-like protein [Boeremia exigua]KAH6625810.1 HEAT repeat protein-like protein [Boeremia exigua]
MANPMETFQRLKQPCIQVLHATSALAQAPDAKRRLVHALASLLHTLTAVASQPGALDPKLAEYAFVPVSQVLRLSRQVPVRALELCLECVSVLLRSGWGGGLEPALSGQLLILFTFLAKPSSAENGIAATSEELQAHAFTCIRELFTQVSHSKSAKDALVATNNIPALGEAVLITLESLAESKSNTIKLAAVDVIKSLIPAVVDDDALASFFPKMVSSLTRILTPGSSNKAGYRVIEQGLQVMTSLLSRMLNDDITKDLRDATTTSDSNDTKQTLRTMSWLQATASQIKIALANVYKMRSHDKPEVRRALLKLCLCVIQDCRISLSDSTSMSIETVLSLIGRDSAHDDIENELRNTLSADQKLVGLLRESLHDWVVSFPRVMRSPDDNKRRLIIHQMSVALRLLGQDPAVIDDRLADGLRDGVSAVLADSKGLEEVSRIAVEASLETSLTLGPSRQSSFQPLQLQLKGQQDLMAEFRLLLSHLAKTESALNIARDLIHTVSQGTREMQLASYWISVSILRETTAAQSLDDFIDVGSINPREELLDDLYSHSIEILTDQDTDVDLPWHFYALALETIALQAGRFQAEFRAELGEVLYPILHQLGSSNPALREHSITCLNIVSDASGYSSAQRLVIDNVDYVVNAVGLKLAVGDVSPQAPQVLLMMMRLCGPSLLPYLDDLVGSIFEALERYHGYPRLVELLFSVLKGMTEEGVKAPPLAIEAPGPLNTTTVGYADIPITDVTSTLGHIRSDRTRRAHEATQEVPIPFPQTPWTGNSAPDSEHPVDQPTPEKLEPPPPAPRTYHILFTISELTQHYLTSPSPSLRMSLLTLLQTTLPALAKHENSFLPLINTLWPVLLPRLHDSEAYIVSRALEVIGVICKHAGTFMRSRIESAFDVLKKLHRHTQERPNTDASKGNQGGKHEVSNLDTIATSFSSLVIAPAASNPAQLDRPELYRSTPARMIWAALVSCLCAVASHVSLRDEQFEEVLDILDPVLSRPDVKSAIDKVNADSVWLRLYKKQRSSQDKKAQIVPEAQGRWELICI